jgi:hypothetical protein
MGGTAQAGLAGHKTGESPLSFQPERELSLKPE